MRLSVVAGVVFGACVSLAGSGAIAGTLSREHLSCENGYNSYEISWVGPWSESLIFMERKYLTSGTWNFYIGYLATSGKHYPTPINYSYRMMAQGGGSPYLDSNVIFIPKQTCSPPP